MPRVIVAALAALLSLSCVEAQAQAYPSKPIRFVIPFGAGWEIWGYQVNGEVANVSIALILIFALGSVGVYGAIIGEFAALAS